MCYASQQVIRKEFDYNAYIAGRLRGEYVVIYNTITEEADTVLPEDIKGKELIFVQENKDISDLPDYLFLRHVTEITEYHVGSRLTSFDTYLVHCCSLIKPLNTFAFASLANCRGAPRCIRV
jgi:hypothetical protein